MAEQYKHPWLEPLVFRNGKSLPSRIIPGPMDGISEGSYVAVMSSLGLVRSWFTPFIRISNGIPRMARLRDALAPYLATGLPVIAQIMGTRTEFLAETAARLHALGATCVDLNCACPSATVLGSHSGGYHLADPDWIASAIREMKRAGGDGAVSVKIRCGFSGTDEMEDIAAAIRDAAPDMVTCHFRTVRELYMPVDGGLERLAKMRSLLPGIPFIGSGDLFAADDAMAMYRIADVDGVAPARGLLRNPALLREIECACQAVERPQAWSDEQRLAFLEKVGDMSGLPRRNQGFLARMAREMFGEDSPEFRKIMEHLTSGH